MVGVTLSYEGDQHATAAKEPHHDTVSVDCPFTSQGEEMSPGNLIGIGGAGCMLLPMGALAQQDKPDLIGTVVGIGLTETDKPFAPIDTVTLVTAVPRDFPAEERTRRERAADARPINRSFRSRSSRCFFAALCTLHDAIPTRHHLFGCDHQMHAVAQPLVEGFHG